MVDLDEAIQEFLIESRENLDQLDRDFVALETQPGEPGRIAAIFRTIHTIKGTAGLLGYQNLEHLAHAGESLLSNVREGTLALTPELTSALLAMVDRIRGVLEVVERSGQDSQERHEDLVQQLHALNDPAGQHPQESPHAVPTASAPSVASSQAAAAPTAHDAPAPESPRDTESDAQAAGEDSISHDAAAATPAAATPAPAPTPPPAQPTASPATAPAPAATAPAAPAPAAPAPAATAPAATAAKPAEGSSSPTTDLNVRVDVGLLDKLMNLVGELVLARNQLLQYGARIEDPAFTSASQRLSLITTELQEQVMKTRMQPIGTVWSKLPRMVRDLAVSLGRQVRIEMQGAETELDRTILEAIKDPLTHIVRNSVDHGIEDLNVRLAAGKPRTGTLSLRAFHEGGQVNLEISDDGKGLQPDAIRRRAVERGIVSSDRAARMSEGELYQLIFMPGFSTAEKVSNVSGRGVGMDVVKTNIERIGGTVDITSQPGAGTTIRIKIPLTLAIIPALVVTSGTERYAIPQVNLLELVGLDEEEAAGAIERIHGSAFFRLRGRLLPLVFLAEQFRPGAEVPSRELPIPRVRRQATALPEPVGPANIVVLQADDQQFGLVVDEVQDTEEIVVKPLGKELKGLPFFEGATIMGDGRVALILDVAGLAQHAHAMESRRAGATELQDEDEQGTAEETAEKQALLLFSVNDEETMAVPLSRVARIEEFPLDKIERAGRRPVAQYRGAILPLLELASVLHEGNAQERKVHVIVYSAGGRSVGFVVHRILDVVEDVYQLDRATARPNVLGAAVVQGRVIEILDAEDVVRTQAPSLLPQSVM